LAGGGGIFVTSAFLSWNPPARVAAAINRWFDAESSSRALWIFLALFVAIWTSFQIVSYASIGLHSDLLEVFAWSQNPAAGYKHPPLAGFVAAAWFAIFPITDWSFHLLAMVNAAVAFFAIDLIARRYLDGDKRLLVLLLLLLTPFYQFHGQRFSTNQILLSTWPIATWCFLRSFETRTLGWSAAAGAAAALAVLGKYYSILLVAAFVIAALMHPRRFDYLRSPAPWVAAAVGLIVLAPHLHWFFTTGGKTLSYAQQVHGGLSIAALLWQTVSSTVSAIGYVIILLLAYVLIVQPDRRTLRATLWPDEPDRRMLVVLLSAPLLLPIIVMPLSGIKFSALWTLPAWFLLPIVLLSPQSAQVKRPDAVRLASIILCLSVAMLAASPAIAWARFVGEAAKPDRAHFAAVSEALTRAWRLATKQPLKLVGSDTDLANAASFYSSDHPRSWNLGDPQLTPWIAADRPPRDDWAAVCPATLPSCLAFADRAVANAPGVIRQEYDHTATLFGRRGPPVRFIFVLVPPRSDPPQRAPGTGG
jgi:4-amino-4-deoxy-L-arabinose transferase-like glycosyltransferase